jgi:hypothetical protein
LIITQEAFPYGRAVPQYSGGSAKTGAPAAPVGNQSYMSSLAPIYAAIANGTQLQQRIRQVAPVSGSVTAAQVSDPVTSTDLPFVQLTAVAPTSKDASALAVGAASVLTTYVQEEQNKAGIAPSDRVLLSPVQTGDNAQLISHQKLTTPVLIFVAIACATFGLAFILENARPRTAAKLGRVPPDSDPEDADVSTSTHDAPLETTRLGPTGVIRTPPLARDPGPR